MCRIYGAEDISGYTGSRGYYQDTLSIWTKMKIQQRKGYIINKETNETKWEDNAAVTIHIQDLTHK